VEIPHLLPGQPQDTLLQMIEDLRSRRGRWAVIFGSGLSAGAGLPDWATLTRELAAEVGHDAAGLEFGSQPGQVPSEKYPEILGQCESEAPRKFWSYVTKRICRSVIEPSPAQRLLAQLPFELFVSLNYDCLVESCWRALRKPDPDDVMVYPQIKLGRLSGGRLVYVHGRCPAGTARLKADVTVLTDTSYLKAYSAASPVPPAVGTICRDYNVLLVGTSLGDPDLNFIVRTEQIRAANAPADLTTPTTWIYLKATDEVHYSPRLQWTEPDLRGRVKPVFYPNPDRKHQELENFLAYLARAVNQ